MSLPSVSFGAPQLQQVILRPRPDNARNIAIGGTSTADSNAIAVGSVAARLVADIPCWVTIGQTPTATVGNGSWFVPADSIEYFQVNQADKIAVIRNSGTATGTLNVVELTR